MHAATDRPNSLLATHLQSSKHDPIGPRERDTQRQDTKKNTGPRPEATERPARELGLDHHSRAEATSQEALDEDARRSCG